MAAILHTAKANAFDPLKDYLDGLVWDGIPRLDTFFEVYFGAQTVDGAGVDITQLVRRLSRCWLISAAARGLQPGCKVDTVLILEGEQGVKKTTALHVLGGEWSSDSTINVTDKDSKMLAARSWIVEMPELSAMRASDLDAQKAFFSSRIDKFRPPYGVAVEDFPRHCVFVGSVNDEQYMIDLTGNRRFWPIYCTLVLLAKLRRDRDQVWAEAAKVFKEGGAANCAACAAGDRLDDGEARCEEHRWWLTRTEDKQLEAMNNQRLKSNFAEAIAEAINKRDLKDRAVYYTLYDVATQLVGLPPDRVDLQKTAIGRALKVLRFTQQRVQIDGFRQLVYRTPAEILKAPKRTGARFLSVVRPSAPGAKG